ncbi:hypothetical protein EX895_004334 [Sporisorium graminicola]|uniref:Uncharacterized protein n=1 Tax=Sporisorium graminicola TaxID=280036 RepID=A0A4U7KQM0_9BASI|nr:hypothetical protein EX895_004334 [Sporisorium graminicola]TKY86694.1 hypothetical protein EX895_004334 [Sporisorium graminicola]
MASTSSSSVAGGSAAQHIDVGVEGDNAHYGSAAEALDEEMAGDATPAAEGTQSPQSANNGDPQDSDLAASFYQNDGNRKRQSGATLAETKAIEVGDDDDDDLMGAELPGREEWLLDEKIRARYIQEIGDIF